MWGEHMASTTSISFPNMFDAARNSVAVLEDNESIVNRSRLLMLTEPTELYNSPDFGVGLKQHLWKYNTPNVKAIIQDKIVEQLRLHEPCVDPESTSFADGLLFTGGEADSSKQSYNMLSMTVGLVTKFQDKIEVKLNEE